MFVTRHLENPSRHGWNTHVGALLDMPEARQRESGHVRLNMQVPLGGTALEERERLIEICRTEVNTYLARNGIMIDEGSHTNLVRVAGRAFQRASLTLNECVKDGFPRDEPAPRRARIALSARQRWQVRHLPDRFGNRGGNATKIIGKWIRALGLTDARLSPSHSWRHRFQTMHRRYGLALDHVDAITGHARRNVGDSYGEFPISILKREIEKLPAWIGQRTKPSGSPLATAST